MNIFSNIYNFTIYEWVLVGLYLFFFIVQLVYYLYLYRKPYRYLSKNNNDESKQLNKAQHPGISIVITAKNEAKNLSENLPFILEQDYPKFQVIVVNNGSTDNSEDVLNNLQSKYIDKLYVTYLPVESEVVNSKKLALTIGIKAAKHDILLFTEADTKPLSNKWVNEYAKEFAKGMDVVLGGCQLKVCSGFYRKFILFDNLLFGLEYLSMALIKKPYSGVERNMAYRKDLFFKNKGFSSILNIEHGEDHLFINKIANSENTSVLISPESMVKSNIANSLSTWRSFKGKYLITKKHLNGFQNKILPLEIVSRYSFYFSFVLMFITGVLLSSITLIALASSLFIIRYIVQVIVINKNSKLYDSGKFILSLLPLDLLTPIVNYQFLNYEKKRNYK